MMHVLGIESSCDETAASIFHAGNDGKKGTILSNVLFSQIQLHTPFGGVVPEIASRSHLERIPHIVDQACKDAHVTLEDIDVIAATNRPGLPGSLLIGLCFAKAIAYATGKKLVGVNHIEAHALSPLIEQEIPFPHLCFTASGGHTSLFLIENPLTIIPVGTTLDDAAGEAFDKVAKLLNLGYPGGPVIEKLARKAQFVDYFKYPRLKQKTTDFSFSGLKTAVLYDLVKQGAYDLATKTLLPHADDMFKMRVSSSFLVCMGDIVVDRTKRACELFPAVRAVSFAGGVACNKYLANRLAEYAKKEGLPFFCPSPQFCTDNGAMVAFAGYQRAKAGLFDELTLDIG